MNKAPQKLREYIESIRRGDRKLPKDGMLILFLAGILLYVISLPASNNNTRYQNKSSKEEAQTANTEAASAQEETEYCEKLEQRLEAFLSQVEGVGEVSVLIYTDSSDLYIVEKEAAQSQDKREETTVYTTNEYGEQVPFIAQTRQPPIEGVVIAATGARDESLRIQLIHMAMTLYGIEANKVEVLPLQEK